MLKLLAKSHHVLAATVVLAMIGPSDADEIFQIPLTNPSFTEGVGDNGVPSGWSKYEGGRNHELKIVDRTDVGKAILIADGDQKTSVGVRQSFKLKGGETYQVTVKVCKVAGASSRGSYLQLRFLPSNKTVQGSLSAYSTKQFSEVSVLGQAPPDTTRGVIYLYTHAAATPKVLVTDVKIEGGFPPPPPPPSKLVPPQFDSLKNLHLDIPLVKRAKPAVAIVVPTSGVYQSAAETIQFQIEKKTGVKIPIVPDDDSQAAVPIKGNLIVLGNRSTNKTINALYDLYYCLADLKYPGQQGYIIRTSHNTFGNGYGLVIVGGSDTVGVNQGAKALAAILAKTSSQQGELSIGWTMETKLGKGLKPPTDVQEFKIWEASKGYRSTGVFGWCSISKRMAMYYMTGDEFSAREVVRLSFPDKQATRDIEQIDGEKIENKHDPLAGFYHYSAHMAILLWDMIEESPVFTDEERLKITNAFARQLNHRKNEGVYGLMQPRSSVGTRHGQWSAISLYCLGRYFDKYYPDPIWAQCVRGSQLAFRSLHEHAWLAGENDNLFWYSTGIAPVLTYMTLTGDRKPLENGVLATLLNGQEVLASGQSGDSTLKSASMGFLNKAAYLTEDGRWITYRQRTGVDTDVFRLGQSFWPDETLKPKLPVDLVGKWNIMPLSAPAWEARKSGLPFEQSFYVGSYRSTPDDSGDFILLDGFNGASRNPYHTFCILQLRIDGRTILNGYHNQVLTSADGMVEPAVAMNAALLHADVVGQTAVAVGEVPNAAFCNWRRGLVQRTGRYALVVDDLTFRTDSRNMKVTTTWQVAGGRWNPKLQAIRMPAGRNATTGDFELHSCDVQGTSGGRSVTMAWNGEVKKDQHRQVFYLIGQKLAKSSGSVACVRIADNAAALSLPQPALAVVGEYGKVKGELVVVAADHVFGHAMTGAGINGSLVSSDVPVELDWDFASGVVNVVTEKETTLTLNLAASDKLRLNGKPAKAPFAGGICRTRLPAGRHVISGASPAADISSAMATALEGLLAKGRKLHEDVLASVGPKAEPTAAELPTALTSSVGGKVVEMITIPSAKGTQLAVAEGSTIHLLTSQGEEIRKLQADGNIRVLHWWDEYDLLLAGCVDEKVIAFDGQGRRKWVFTSEMDPAVYEAGKQYWFKSAPGHEGVHGLHTGVFDNEKNRCFVGSACTLEILDETGQLVKRTPVFWGPGRMFLLMDGPDDTRNLLISRWRNGNDRLAVVNSKSMAVTGSGYYEVPPRHTYVGGWAAQNRTAVVHEDIDGDGKKEVVTTINGIWNRVTVYSEDGAPLHNAQFGPGPSKTPKAQMRGMDLADLNGDGKKEIVIGTWEGLIVALSNDCRRVWSTRLSSPPTSIKCITPRGAKFPWIVAGCDDGTVVVLDQRGEIIRLGTVVGRPTQIKVLDTTTGPLVVLATDKGEVKGFKIGG